MLVFRHRTTFSLETTGFLRHTVEPLTHPSVSPVSLQLIGWLLVAVMAVSVFLSMCVKRCTSPLGYQQENYWSRYRSSEKNLFQRTADVHARLLAAEHVRKFFGFVALEKEEKEEQEALEQQGAGPIRSSEWNRVTGVYLYREKNGLPLYSRLNKWATYELEDNVDKDMDMDREMDTLS